jgi:cyclic dehypoxanthinyl futalosine synthase
LGKLAKTEGDIMTTTTPNLTDISLKVMSDKRISKEEGLFLLKDAPLLELGNLAQQVRFKHNPERHVTFVIDTNLNYTNVCDAYCTFCAFYRTEKDSDAYTYNVEQVMEMVGQAASKGVTTVLMQGGLNSKLPLEYYKSLVSETKKKIPRSSPSLLLCT